MYASNSFLSNCDCKKLDQSSEETFSFCLIIISLELILELMVNKKIVNVIKEDAVVSIQVVGGYYHRVYDLVLRLMDRQENMQKTLINIDTPDTPLTIDEACIQTFGMLLKSIEEATQSDLENLTREHTIEYKEEEETPEEEATDPS